MSHERIKGVVDYIKESREVLLNIDITSVDAFINELFEAWINGNTIFFVGNGGSASTSVHFAADLNNTTRKLEEKHPKIPRVKAISLNDNLSRLSALTNDEGWINVYIEQLKNFFKAGDVVVAISVHGGSGSDKAGTWSQNLPAALNFAKENGGRALSFTGFGGGIMKDICDVNVNVPINSTPHVEGLHLVLHHLVFQELAARIEEHLQNQNA